MKVVYLYEVIYRDDNGMKHLHFCEGVTKVKAIRERFEVIEVIAINRTVELER